MAGKLYYGDNLGILQRYVADESIDLVYLDPPFKSDQNYNVLFMEQDGSRAAAQIKAFEDTWRWDKAAASTFQEVVESGGKVSQVMQAFRTFLGDNDMLAYLSMMAPRLKELRRVLKNTGSIYLHCDPTASHYLKLLLDAVFGPDQFRNEIIWRRTGAHNKARRYAPIHDTLLFFTKSDDYYWSFPKRPYMKGHVTENFVCEKGVWKTNYYGNVLTGQGIRGGESGKPWKGFDPTAKARHWAIPGALVEDLEEDISHMGQHEKLDYLYKLGCIKIEKGQAWPVYERVIKESDGQPVADIWAYQPYTEGTVFNSEEGIDHDVRWLNPKDQERLGYPTQKPLGMLDRIIKASCPEQGTVLDPFCGCGTTITEAESQNRNWIGIDITHLAITLIRHRLKHLFSTAHYEIIGEPVSIQDAQELAAEDPYQFQWWALGLVNARPVEQKKGSDKGIDGRLYFHDETAGKTKQIIFSVKSGHVTSNQVRDLRGVIEREKAEIGVFITLNEPTAHMKSEAASAGFYVSPFGKYPKLQILTVAQLLQGVPVQYPTEAQRIDKTFKKAVTPTKRKKADNHQELPL